MRTVYRKRKTLSEYIRAKLAAGEPAARVRADARALYPVNASALDAAMAEQVRKVCAESGVSL